MGADPGASVRPLMTYADALTTTAGAEGVRENVDPSATTADGPGASDWLPITKFEALFAETTGDGDPVFPVWPVKAPAMMEPRLGGDSGNEGDWMTDVAPLTTIALAEGSREKVDEAITTGLPPGAIVWLPTTKLDDESAVTIEDPMIMAGGLVAGGVCALGAGLILAAVGEEPVSAGDPWGCAAGEPSGWEAGVASTGPASDAVLPACGDPWAAGWLFGLGLGEGAGWLSGLGLGEAAGWLFGLALGEAASWLFGLGLGDGELCTSGIGAIPDRTLDSDAAVAVVGIVAGGLAPGEALFSGCTSGTAEMATAVAPAAGVAVAACGQFPGWKHPAPFTVTAVPVVKSGTTTALSAATDSQPTPGLMLGPPGRHVAISGYCVE